MSTLEAILTSTLLLVGGVWALGEWWESRQEEAEERRRERMCVDCREAAARGYRMTCHAYREKDE